MRIYSHVSNIVWIFKSYIFSHKRVGHSGYPHNKRVFHHREPEFFPDVCKRADAQDKQMGTNSITENV